MRKTISRRWRRFCWLALPACLGLTLPPAALAQAGAPAPAILSPRAQAALKKGLAAAQEQKWESAIRSFQEARKLSPNTPEIYYDLGLAESKIPGRELRAIAWFSAYLVANPNAPNAAAINDRILELYKVVRSNTYRLVELVQDTALKASPAFRDANLMDVVQVWVYAHEYSAAFKTVDLIQNASIKTGAIRHIVYGQASHGDIVGAKRTLLLAEEAASLIQDAEGRADAKESLVHATEFIADAPRQMAHTVERLKQNTPQDSLKWVLESLVNGTFNDPKFLDLASYLKSVPSDDPQKSFHALEKIATDVAIAQDSFSDWPGSVLKGRKGDLGNSSGQ